MSTLLFLFLRGDNMRKTTLAIYKWTNDKAWVFIGCTPITQQAKHVVEILKKQGIEAKIVLRYL